MTDRRKQEEQKQERKKYTDAMIKKLAHKNQKYYVLDSECIGLRIYVQITGAKSFYLQRYIPEYQYSKKTKIGDFPEMSITQARKLGAMIKADNVQGKDPILAKAARQKDLAMLQWKIYSIITLRYHLRQNILQIEWFD